MDTAEHNGGFWMWRRFVTRKKMTYEPIIKRKNYKCQNVQEKETNFEIFNTYMGQQLLQNSTINSATSSVINFVIRTMTSSMTFLCSSTFPKCSVHPKKSMCGLFKGCAHVCLRATTSFATWPFTSFTNHQVCA
jgi:hypothetical protein